MQPAPKASVQSVTRESDNKVAPARYAVFDNQAQPEYRTYRRGTVRIRHANRFVRSEERVSFSAQFGGLNVELV